MTYVIRTPNARYTGMRAGATFVNGRAEVVDRGVRDTLITDLHYLDCTAEETKGPSGPPASYSATVRTPKLP